MFPAWQPPEFERQADIVRYGPPGKQIGFLKDKGDPLITTSSRDGAEACECELTRGGGDQTRDESQQGRLTAPGRAQ